MSVKNRTAVRAFASKYGKAKYTFPGNFFFISRRSIWIKNESIKMPVAAESGRSILNTLKKTFHYFLSPTTAFTVSSISSNVQSNGGHLWKKGCCGFMQDIFTMRLSKSNFSEKSPISRCASFRFFILSSSLRSSSFDFLTSYKKSIVQEWSFSPSLQ